MESQTKALLCGTFMLLYYLRHSVAQTEDQLTPPDLAASDLLYRPDINSSQSLLLEAAASINCAAGTSSTRDMFVSQSYSGSSFIKEVYIDVPASAIGSVNTMAGQGPIGYENNAYGYLSYFSRPHGMQVNREGTYIYIADRTNYCVRRMRNSVLTGSAYATDTLCGTCTVQGYVDGAANVAKFDNEVSHLSLTYDGKTLYISQVDRIRVYSFTTNTVSTLAGDGSGVCGGGTGMSASFTINCIHALRTSNYLLALGGNVIYRVDRSTGSVEIIAGDCSSFSNLDGTGTDAKFQTLKAMAIVDDESKFYVYDSYAFVLKQITYPGMVVTFIAGKPGVNSFIDGSFSTATLGYANLVGMAINPVNNDEIYITGGQKVRMIKISTSSVSTFSGSGAMGNTDGSTSATSTFTYPSSIVVYSCPVTCPAGQYGYYTCTAMPACPVNYYQPDTKSNTCQQCATCDSGSYMSGCGGTSAGICVNCTNVN